MTPAARRDPQCQQSLDALLLGVDDDAARSHRDSCPRCQTAVAELDRVRLAFDAASRRGLDDLKRARMQSRLMQQLEHRGKARPRWRVMVWAAAAVVVLALGLVLVRQLSRPEHPRVVVAHARVRLVPYLLSGPSLVGPAADPGLRQDRDTLAVPPGGRLRAALLAGSTTTTDWSRQLVGRVTLVGPGRVRLVPSTDGELRLRLEGGVLLAQVTPGHARVRVSAGDVEVTVVGTLFLVEARQERPAQVAVARGAVDVSVGRGPSIRVSAGRRWTSGDGVGHLAPAQSRWLADHDQGLVPPPPTESGILVLSGVPARVRASLDRADLGHTPLAALLPVGPATISLGAPDHLTTQITVQINAGQVTRLGYSLNRLARGGGDAGVAADAARRTRPVARPTVFGPKTMAPDAPAADATPAAPDAAPATPDAGAAPPTAEDLYRQAEQALRDGARARAAVLLSQIIRQFPTDALTPTAQFELARLAYEARQFARARRHLDQVLANPRARLHHDPAHFLRCRLMVQQRHNDQARRCLGQFRRRFPRSPHDEEALYVLGRLALAAGDCKAARPVLQQYLRRYPRGVFAREATRLQASCAP